MKKAVYKNPLLSGFYPDPSICRVGEDYYMVTSTFVIFPGLPIFHSRDLANWTQIGHVLSSTSQLELNAHWHHGGIFAPTLRYINEQFYLVCTNVGGGGHFYMTAKEAQGPWSEAIYLTGDGIDPDIFQAADGRIWFSATRSKSEPRFDGDNEIWLQEFDPDQGRLVGEIHVIWGGFADQAIWTEAPHLYYREPYYYVLTAEGGTGHEHAVVIGRSKDLFGPYEPNHMNPILTHRHLGRDYPVVNVGHADLVSTPSGDYYMMALASRPYGGYYRNLGRETFIAAVKWEDGWPIVNAGYGRLHDTGTIDLEVAAVQTPSERIDFNQAERDLRLVCIRGRQWERVFKQVPEHGLKLQASDERLDQPGNPTAIFRRQCHKSYRFELQAQLPEIWEDRVSVGVTAFHDNFHYYRLAIVRIVDTAELHIIRRTGSVEEILYMMNLGPVEALLGRELSFVIEQREQELKFALDLVELTTIYDARLLSPDVASGFVGTLLGAYIQYDQEMEFVAKEEEYEFLQKKSATRYFDTEWILNHLNYDGKD